MSLNIWRENFSGKEAIENVIKTKEAYVKKLNAYSTKCFFRFLFPSAYKEMFQSI